MKNILNKAIIENKRIYLRKLTLSDINQRYLSWMNDKRVNKYLESRFQRWNLEDLKKYWLQINKSDDNLFLAIILKNNNEHIGNVKIGPIDRIHRFAYVGLIIGEKSCWGKGFGAETLQLAVKHAFEKLKLHKLNAGIYGNNIASIKAFQKSGFKIEGIRKKQYLSGNHYVDDVTMSIIRK